MHRIISKIKSLQKKYFKKRNTYPQECSRQEILGNDVAVMANSHIDSASKIENYTYIGYNCFITKTDIGRYCSIANNVSIGMGEHPLDRISTNSIFYENAKEELTKKECVIKNDVWIGVDSIIRRGVKIGNGAVIGANSFVNSDVPDYAIVAGSPAKIIRFRFNMEQQEIINKSRWWEQDKEEAKKIVKELENKILETPKKI